MFWVIAIVIIVIVVLVIRSKNENEYASSVSSTPPSQNSSAKPTPHNGSDADAVIANSECAKVVADTLCSLCQSGGKYYEWLMENPERSIQVEVEHQGVRIIRSEVNRRRLKETGTYEVDREGWIFQESGYSNLPSINYIRAFLKYLLEQVQSRCPDVKVVDNFIMKR